MRPSRCRCPGRDLAVLLLAVAVCRSPAFAGGPKPKPAPKPVTTVRTFEEKGYAVSEDMARRDALDKLRLDVGNWLADNHPEITYTPSMAELESISEFGPPEPYKRPRGEDLPEDAMERQPMVQVALKAELTNVRLSDFMKQTRLLMTEQRQSVLARGLAGAVALLLVGSGYLRLEEKVGRHRRKLGMVAVGVLGLVGLTLCWRWVPTASERYDAPTVELLGAGSAGGTFADPPGEPIASPRRGQQPLDRGAEHVGLEGLGKERRAPR